MKKDIPEYIRKQRGDWGQVNPVTKVIPNKKKDQKVKHKGREFDNQEKEVIKDARRILLYRYARKKRFI